jgi:hypothetical protein
VLRLSRVRGRRRSPHLAAGRYRASRSRASGPASGCGLLAGVERPRRRDQRASLARPHRGGGERPTFGGRPRVYTIAVCLEQFPCGNVGVARHGGLKPSPGSGGLLQHWTRERSSSRMPTCEGAGPPTREMPGQGRSKRIGNGNLYIQRKPEHPIG